MEFSERMDGSVFIAVLAIPPKKATRTRYCMTYTNQVNYHCTIELIVLWRYSTPAAATILIHLFEACMLSHPLFHIRANLNWNKNWLKALRPMRKTMTMSTNKMHQFDVRAQTPIHLHEFFIDSTLATACAQSNAASRSQMAKFKTFYH